MARKYFGDENPVGEIIRLNNAHDYTVTGIVANPPSNSHISFSAVVPFMSLYETRAPGSMDQWLNLSYFTYFKANRSFKKTAFFESLSDLFEERFGEQSREYGIDQHLQGVPGVNGIAFSSVYPGEEFSGTVFKPEGAEEESIINYIYADPRYCGLMDIRLVEGRNFDPAFATDSLAVLVNETAARTFGWSDPVGMTIGRPRGENQFETYTVIGVVGDFHFRSMHRLVEPLIIHLLRVNPRYMTLDISPVNFHHTIAGIKEAWDKINPDVPFDFALLSDKYDSHYRAEIQLGRIFTFFSLMAFLIAALGMYGLSSFMVENRTKEIGVRKVFGASERSIVLIFFRQFGWWLLIANIVSWVVAWYFIGKWLEMFAYSIPVKDPLVFAGAALMSVFVVFMASGYQSLKAALIDPARSLRYE